MSGFRALGFNLGFRGFEISGFRGLGSVGGFRV